MYDSTKQLLKAVSDSVQFEGYTQSISMLIQHRLTPEDKIRVLSDIDKILTDSPNPVQ